MTRIVCFALLLVTLGACAKSERMQPNPPLCERAGKDCR